MRAYIGSDPDADPDADPDYSNWEGWSQHEDQGVEWWWKLDVTDEMLDHECASLVGGLCEVWDGLPAVCRHFPMQPRDIEKFPKCGFWFERAGGLDEEKHE